MENNNLTINIKVLSDMLTEAVVMVQVLNTRNVVATFRLPKVQIEGCRNVNGATPHTEAGI